MLDTLSLASHGPVIPVIVIQRLQDAVPLPRRWWPAASRCWR
jgi:2-keto-3-deoxy-6-phosphogluconate aldolase